MTMLTVGGRGYRVHPVQGQVTLADVVAARDSLQRIIDDFAAARAETADATIGAVESGAADYAHVFHSEVDTAEGLPRRRSVSECMVLLLDDDAIVAQLRAVAAPGSFGQVIHDVAAAMAGEL